MKFILIFVVVTLLLTIQLASTPTNHQPTSHSVIRPHNMHDSIFIMIIFRVLFEVLFFSHYKYNDLLIDVHK